MTNTKDKTNFNTLEISLENGMPDRRMSHLLDPKEFHD